MSWWKVVGVVVLLAFPLAYALGQVSSGSDDPAPRPGIVLSTPTPEGRPAAAPPSPRNGGTPKSTDTPKPTRTPKPPQDPPAAVHDCDDEDDDDDDGVIVVHPCPEDLDDDDDDDDAGDNDDDDG
jgi:hypothetical protein